MNRYKWPTYKKMPLPPMQGIWRLNDHGRKWVDSHRPQTKQIANETIQIYGYNEQFNFWDTSGGNYEEETIRAIYEPI